MVDTASVTSVMRSPHVSLHVCHLDRVECESCQGLFSVLPADVRCLFVPLSLCLPSLLLSTPLWMHPNSVIPYLHAPSEID